MITVGWNFQCWKTRSQGNARRHCQIVFEKAQEQQKAEGYIKLECGFATIPLPGIDVPFHSWYLWAGVLLFHACTLMFSHDEFPFELIFSFFQIFPRKLILVILTQICLWASIFQISLWSHSMFPASTLRSSMIRLPRWSWTRFSRSGNSIRKMTNVLRLLFGLITVWCLTPVLNASYGLTFIYYKTSARFVR